MIAMMNQLWIDERGYTVSAELVVVATILVLGLIVGMSQLRTALVEEYKSLAFAFRSLNQSYSFPGFRGDMDGSKGAAWTMGSRFDDRQDQGNVVSDFAGTVTE